MLQQARTCSNPDLLPSPVAILTCFPLLAEAVVVVCFPAPLLDTMDRVFGWEEEVGLGCLLGFSAAAASSVPPLLDSESLLPWLGGGRRA